MTDSPYRRYATYQDAFNRDHHDEVMAEVEAIFAGFGEPPPPPKPKPKARRRSTPKAMRSHPFAPPTRDVP